ncbi:MAG: pyrroline-5-carboxylate reductase [Chitinophagaceae bacterium]
MDTTITIIGGGNLGTAIAEGLINKQFCKASQLTITRRNINHAHALHALGAHITSDNVAAVKQSEWIILAVKPFQTTGILEQIASAIQPHHKIISVVTGVWLKELQSIVGTNNPLFRAMPNTAIAIGESMTCICSANASESDIAFVTQLFNQLGKSIVIEEALMDAATVLGACGTAYAMRFIRANIQGGIEIGFSAATASLIAAQTVKGAAELLLQKNTHPEQEIDKVTTPKGCTIAGLNEMEHKGFSSSLIKGITASYHKIKN